MQGNSLRRLASPASSDRPSHGDSAPGWLPLVGHRGCGNCKVRDRANCLVDSAGSGSIDRLSFAWRNNNRHVPSRRFARPPARYEPGDSPCSNTVTQGSTVAKSRAPPAIPGNSLLKAPNGTSAIPNSVGRHITNVACHLAAAFATDHPTRDARNLQPKYAFCTSASSQTPFELSAASKDGLKKKTVS